MRELTLAAVLALANMAADAEPLKVAVIDGSATIYGNQKDPNHVVLGRILPKLLKHLGEVSVEYFPVQMPDEDGVFNFSSRVSEYEPDLVFAHWSAFLPAAGDGYCVPYMEGENGRCAIEVLKFLYEIFGSMHGDTRFVVYSRSSSLCDKEYGYGMRSLVLDGSVLSGQEAPFLRSIGLVAFVSGTNRQDFEDKLSQDVLSGLATHLIGDRASKWNNPTPESACLLYDLE